ncbi:hypothetical protein SAMN05216412_10696 [Nitrosospira multiformis]|uniref:Uncharacterized protein n=1 Tax=Nitrosospira multiformis TaxID=1231 RepID=A0A1I0EC51_9PROT|nr:hypothetical protein [Nitrosospira multiformis]SET42331.1 hypothetical protein SAMN05216412_10696 [Nitrosospira multiformis]
MKRVVQCGVLPKALLLFLVSIPAGKQSLGSFFLKRGAMPIHFPLLGFMLYASA